MKDDVALKPKKAKIAFDPTSLMQFCERSDRITHQLAKRAFQLFEERGCEHGHDLDDWFKAEAELLTPIPIKVKETAGEIRVEAEVGGFNDDEVAFNLEKNQLTIQGIKQTSHDDATGSESQFQMVYGSISLPSEVVTQKAHATLKDGILEIVAPKSTTKPVKAIAVSAA
jgi:HSP20 family molecular chaperone IbpA